MNIEEIFIINNQSEFETIAFNNFCFQYNQVALYREFCDLLKKNPKNISNIFDIPFLPIRFFRTHKICTQENFELEFHSSGTTGFQTSKHYVASKLVYEQSFSRAFNYFYGNFSEYLWLALMPDSLQRKNSSLIYMVQYFVYNSKYSRSGFYLNRFKELYEVLIKAIEQNIPTICIGLTYALLDFAEQYSLPANHIIFIETGGMKGKRPDMPREKVHQFLKESLAVENIHSEYGMTELLSQAYSKKDGIFESPPWMKIMIRDVYNPQNKNLIGLRGGINIIDLANIFSCSFIETEDLGIAHQDNTFNVLGRLDNSIIRGCNTMID